MTALAVGDVALGGKVVATTRALKAYIGHDGDEGWCVVFARSGIAARRDAANELDCGFGDIDHCRRAPSLDKFAEDGVIPIEAMLDLGWWFECYGCGRRVSNDEDYDDGDDDGDGDDHEGKRKPKLNPVGTKNCAFCTPECKASNEHERRCTKALEKTAISILKRDLLTRFPEATITYERAYVSRMVVKEVQVDFLLPGMKYGASLHYRREDDSRRSWSVCNGDREVLEAYAQAHPKPERAARENAA